MPDEIVLYTNPMSRGRVARWMLEEVGRPYRAEILHYAGSMKAPGYLAINPMGKVPALTHGATVVTENAAICAYLADAFPEAGLAPPPGDPARGTYYRWLFFAAGPMEQASTNRAMRFEVPKEREPMMGYGTYGATLDALEAAVAKGPYLAGGCFTAADLYVASHLLFGMQFGTIEKRPAFEAYAKPLAERPAAVKAREIDDAMLPRDGERS